MNAGEIKGARGLRGHYQGAVTVTGANASFTLNDGKVTDNRRAVNQQYGAANIAVAYGGTVTVNGGEISNGGSEVDANAGHYGVAGGIGAYQGGHVVINGGTITNNYGWTGGVLAYYWNLGANRATIEAQAESHRNTIEINGGTISNNVAGFSGGGVFVFGNGEATMTGGSIEDNAAPNGGGVGTMDLYVAGAATTWEEVPFQGMELGYTAEEWSELSPAAFTMTGGEITGNRATRTGGGVNVISNKVLLTGGEISGNHAAGQGGGIYVATKSYALQLENVLVESNDAAHIGGGIWVCPTGDLELRVTQGGAVFGNAVPDEDPAYGSDFAHDNLGSVGAMEIHLANRLLGGGDVSYFWDNPDSRFDPADPGEPVFMRGDELFEQGLHSAVTDNDKDAARGAAKLLITENTSYRGAGIGTNGTVLIGYGKGVDVHLTKTWQSHDGDTIANDALPDSVLFALQRKAMTDDELAAITAEDGTLDVTGLAGETVREFRVCANSPVAHHSPGTEESWQSQDVCPEADTGVSWTRSLLEYPATDADGNTYVYFVTEAEVEGYTGSVTATRDPETFAFTFDVRNTGDAPPPEEPPVEEPPTEEPPPAPPTTEKPEKKPTGLPDTGRAAR